MLLPDAPIFSEPTRSNLIPDDVMTVFSSTLIFRKDRISMLVNWFMHNYFKWLDPPPTKSVMPMSIATFANELTKSLSLYGIRINGQRVWTWTSKRNLPREDNFHVMANIAEGWQKEFALLVLEILTSEEPNLPDTSMAQI